MLLILDDVQHLSVLLIVITVINSFGEGTLVYLELIRANTTKKIRVVLYDLPSQVIDGVGTVLQLDGTILHDLSIIEEEVLCIEAHRTGCSMNEYRLETGGVWRERKKRTKKLNQQDLLLKQVKVLYFIRLV